MQEVSFVTPLHTRAKRDYVARVVQHDKAECATVAKRWGFDYWDGERQYGYGGMRYDGRWRPVAEAMIRHYGLKAGDRVLDIGCGKAFLLYEFTQALPGLRVAGLDISQYAIDNAKEEMRSFLHQGDCARLPFDDGAFDLVISLNTFHNLRVFELESALREMVRVARSAKYICVESYRNEREKANLLYWQLTCETFFTPEEWRWFYERCGWNGDYEFIYFE